MEVFHLQPVTAYGSRGVVVEQAGVLDVATEPGQ
jgi:hypothetical protein